MNVIQLLSGRDRISQVQPDLLKDINETHIGITVCIGNSLHRRKTVV